MSDTGRGGWWAARAAAAAVAVGLASVPVSAVVAAVTPWHSHAGAVTGPAADARPVGLGA